MQWTLILSITNVICTAPLASAQYAVPMPMYAVAPAAMPVLLPAVALQPPRSTTTSTTTTTTTPRSVALAVPVPVQMPVPFAYAPAAVCQATPRPAHCPPCPPCLCLPSCTPAFFSYCSPCHQKCRCRSGADAPLPMPPVQPVPLQPPPPVIMVPFPPSIRLPRAKHKWRYSSSDTSTDDSRDSCSDDSLETSDSEYFYKRARKRKTSHRKRIHARRNNERPRHNEVVKPVLTYVSENGNVKFKTEISNAEAARLLEKRGSHEHSGQMESIQVTAGHEDGRRPRMVVVSQDNGGSRLARNQEQINLRSGHAKRTLQQGKKRFIFRSPANKKISNLSVSFQVTK